MVHLYCLHDADAAYLAPLIQVASSNDHFIPYNLDGSLPAIPQRDPPNHPNQFSGSKLRPYGTSLAVDVTQQRVFGTIVHFNPNEQQAIEHTGSPAGILLVEHV